MLTCIDYLCPGACVGLREGDVVPPVPGVASFLAMNLRPPTRMKTAKTGRWGETGLLDNPQFVWGRPLVLFVRENSPRAFLFNSSIRRSGRLSAQFNSRCGFQHGLSCTSYDAVAFLMICGSAFGILAAAANGAGGIVDSSMARYEQHAKLKTWITVCHQSLFPLKAFFFKRALVARVLLPAELKRVLGQGVRQLRTTRRLRRGLASGAQMQWPSALVATHPQPNVTTQRNQAGRTQAVGVCRTVVVVPRARRALSRAVR